MLLPASNVAPAAIRGQLQVAFGSSKASLYTQLPELLEEPTPGFDSIADALQDLAAGEDVCW